MADPHSNHQAQGVAITIGSHRLAISGDRALAAVTPAFSHLPQLVQGKGLSPVHGFLHVGVCLEEEQRWHTWARGSHRFADGVLAVIHHDPFAVELHQPDAGARMELQLSEAALKGGDHRAQPAHHALAAWLANRGALMVHAGAVEIDGRAVLLVGRGGSGKSTTALACAQAGFGFLGDDLCVVEPADPASGEAAKVHAIYGTAKLCADSRERLSAQNWPLLGMTPRGKWAVALPDHLSLAPSATLGAIVLVRPGAPSPRAQQAPRLPLSPRAALSGLASTALPVANGSVKPSQWLHTMAALLRDVPVFAQELSWDLPAVADCLRSVLNAH